MNVQILNAVKEQNAKAFSKYMEEDLKFEVIVIREKNTNIRNSARNPNIRRSKFMNEIKRKNSQLQKFGSLTIPTHTHTLLIHFMHILKFKYKKKGFVI